MDIDSAQRLVALEDLEAIRYLRHRWNEKSALMLGSDDKSEVDAARDWFAAHISPDFGFSTNLRKEHHDAVGFLAFLDEMSEAYTFSFHMVGGDVFDSLLATNQGTPHVASATWYSLGMLTLRNEQLWVATVWRERYVKQDGAWLIQNMAGDYKFASPYESGWANEPFVREEILRLVY
jgi:hypothetical protein